MLTQVILKECDDSSLVTPNYTDELPGIVAIIKNRDESDMIDKIRATEHELDLKKLHDHCVGVITRLEYMKRSDNNYDISEDEYDDTLDDYNKYLMMIKEKLNTIDKLKTALEPVQEVFIGKDPLEKMHSIFCGMRNGCLSAKGYKLPLTSSISAFEKEIESVFGFKIFSFGIDPDPGINAFTYPITASFDINGSDYIETTKNGYRLKKECGLVAYSKITKGLWYNKNITNDECFAIFLHEIGHSFVNRSEMVEQTEQATKQMIIATSVLNALLYPWTIPNIIVGLLSSNNFAKKFTLTVSKIAKQFKLARKINWGLGKLWSNIALLFDKATNTALLLTGIPGLIAGGNLAASKGMKPDQGPTRGRSIERLADDFAKIYGYGNELATGLMKLNVESYGMYTFDFVMKNKTLKNWFDRQNDLSSQCSEKFDVHPASVDRILSIKKAMEDDLKASKDLDPRIKKELQQNLDDMNDIVENLKKSKSIMEKDPNTYRRTRAHLQAQKGFKLSKFEKKALDTDTLNKDFDNRLAKEHADFMVDEIMNECVLQFKDYDFE